MHLYNMANAINQPEFAEPQLLEKIDKLFELNIGEYVDLPQVSLLSKLRLQTLLQMLTNTSFWSLATSQAAKAPFLRDSQASHSRETQRSVPVLRHRLPSEESRNRRKSSQ